MLYIIYQVKDGVKDRLKITNSKEIAIFLEGYYESIGMDNIEIEIENNA